MLEAPGSGHQFGHRPQACLCLARVARHHSDPAQAVQAVLEAQAAQAASAAAEESKGERTVGFYQARHYFAKCPSNLLIAAFTGPLTSAVIQNSYTDLAHGSSVSFGTMAA